MATLQQIRERVRTQLDLDDEDLPNTLLDGHIRDGYDRTFAFEQRWPFLETSWTVSLEDADNNVIDLPENVGFISSIRSNRDNSRLVHIAQRIAEENFAGEEIAEGEPSMFSVWGRKLNFWPHAPQDATVRTYNVRGYRTVAWSSDPTVELDGDRRLHAAVFYYAVSLVYAQLEDSDLEMQYIRRWQQLVSDMRREMMRPQFHEPLILNGGIPKRTGFFVG